MHVRALHSRAVYSSYCTVVLYHTVSWLSCMLMMRDAQNMHQIIIASIVEEYQEVQEEVATFLTASNK